MKHTEPNLDTGFIQRLTDRRRGIMVEAFYVPTADGKFRNTHWRLHTPTFGWGTWYKIHGRQTKNINPSLSLIRYTQPEGDGDCPLTEAELCKAHQSL